jgi:L-rhamnose 1-dehydrogenase
LRFSWFNLMHLVNYNATFEKAMNMNTRRFEGKTAVVTGASRGIGRAIAVRLASEGAYVVINYAKGADTKYPGAAEEALRLVREAGGEGEISEADVTDTAAIRRLLRQVDETRGLDILVNNAGICPMLELFEITEELWDRVHAVNLRATFFASQEAARIMMSAATKGRIVCISSIAADIGTPTQIHYCPTKGGVNSVVKAMASVLGPHGITINAVMPGDIATDISREWDEANPEEIQRYIERCPVRRRGRAEDIAAVVAFLAAPEAEFITGSAYLVDGGLTSVM